MQRCAPVKFVFRTASQSSCFMRIDRPSRVIAALFTRMSRRPNFSITCLNPAFTCSASATSIFTAMAVPPAASISVTSVASFSSLRAATATFAPAWTRASAVSLPMPCEAPVTIATLSFRLNTLSPFVHTACLQKAYSFSSWAQAGVPVLPHAASSRDWANFSTAVARLFSSSTFSVPTERSI